MRARIRKLVAGLGVAAAFLVLGELGARLGLRGAVLATIPTEEMRRFLVEEQLVYDPVLGWRPVVDVPSFDAFDKPNTAELQTPQAPGHLTGFAFGDSQTFGAALPREAAWPKVTEATLRARGYDLTVINLGMSGLRSGQVLEIIERYVLPRQPAFLLVDCMVHDDRLRDRHYEPSRWDDVARVLFYSRLYRVLRLGVSTLRGENLGPVGEPEVRQVDPRTAEGPGNHGLIADLARIQGVPLVFVDYPFTAQPARALAPASELPPGVPVAPATAALLASGQSSAELFLDNNHLTVEGSRIVGESVADVLAPLLPAR